MACFLKAEEGKRSAEGGGSLGFGVWGVGFRDSGEAVDPTRHPLTPGLSAFQETKKGEQEAQTHRAQLTCFLVHCEGCGADGFGVSITQERSRHSSKPDTSGVMQGT